MAHRMTSAPVASRSNRAPHTDRNFYSVAAVASLLLVVVGFGPTYFLKPLVVSPGLPLLVHLHGAVMTTWFVLLVVQTRLVARHRVSLHRRLGMAGALVALLVVVLGVPTAVAAARRGMPPDAPPLEFLAITLGDILVFGGLVSAGLVLRRNPRVHRPLMLLASMSMLQGAIGRLPFDFIATGGPAVFLGLTDSCIAACVAWDAWRTRRVNAAFIVGAVVIVLSHAARVWISTTPAWTRFAAWVVA